MLMLMPTLMLMPMPTQRKKMLQLSLPELNSLLVLALATLTAHWAAVVSTLADALVPLLPKNVMVVVDLVMLNPMTMLLKGLVPKG